MKNFTSLGLNPALLEAIQKKGYTTPTPVQAGSIPPALEGRDIFALAQTGTGKTAAFAIPILNNLYANGTPNELRVLVLAPTRELAIQIDASFKVYGSVLKPRMALIYGGVSQKPQEDALRNRPVIVTATPGRLLDLYGQGRIKLDKVDILVLDECDRMLDMGFANDLRKIVALLPQKRQTLLLSATMPSEIREMTKKYLNNPVTVEIPSEHVSPVLIEQRCYHVDRENKVDLMMSILKSENIDQALVFTRTKRGADRLAKVMANKGVSAGSFHGDKSQNQRERCLNDFRKGNIRLLIATDVASRGIDIKELPAVFNYDMPADSETYVHRIGRTGRAGMEGHAISFRTYEDKDIERDIIRQQGQSMRIITQHEFLPTGLLTDPGPKPERSGRGRTGGNRFAGSKSQSSGSSRGNGYSRNESGNSSAPKRTAARW
jgi:ATP-dependent RNA helicase RhlE